jgi:hypothetical protein
MTAPIYAQSNNRIGIISRRKIIKDNKHNLFKYPEVGVPFFLAIRILPRFRGSRDGDPKREYQVFKGS